MKKIQVYGPGCLKCKKLAENVEIAGKELGIELEIDKVTELEAIHAAGVVMTPALAIDGDVKSVGRVLSPQEIKTMLASQQTQ